jgi:hypothetical protein
MLLTKWRPKTKLPHRSAWTKSHCLKSKLRRYLRLEVLEDRTVPSVTLGVTAPGIPGTSSFCGCLPPDGAEAAGPTNVIQTVNTAMEIRDKAGNLLSGPTSLPTFFSGHGFTVNSLSDPVALFDEAAQRFVIAILDFTSTNATDFLDFAVSVNSDATAGFTNFRHINVGETSFFADQPRLGVNADAYFVQFNMFSTFSGSYAHPQIFTIQKSNFLTGGLTTFHHDLSSTFFSVDPANMHGAAAGGPEYFVSEGPTTTQMSVFKETNVLSNTPTDVETDFTVPTIVEPPAAPQPSGTVTTNDSRTMNAAWRDNILVSDHTVGVSGVAKARWYQFDTSAATPTFTQQGDINPGASIATYFPSIDIDTNDDLGVTYIQSSSSEFVSMYVTGRTPSDPTGTMETGVRVIAGTANYTGTRMGDYSGIGIDPVNTTTFWAENEWINNSGAGSWNTEQASFSVASSTAVNTTTTVVSSVNPSTFGQSVTFTATVTPTSGSGTPTGTVTFLDGTSTLGTGTLSSGQATFSTSSLAVGNHVITAQYGGDSNFNSSTSSAITQTVNSSSTTGTTTALSSSANPSVFGQSVTFTATVTPTSGSGTPTGTVTFSDGGVSIGSGTLSGGTTTFATSGLAVGNHTMTASYSGDSNFNSSTSSALTQTVNKDASTTVVTSSPNPSSLGQAVTFTATVTANAPGSGTPTGNVTFTVGTRTLATVTLNSSGHASFTTSGAPNGTSTLTAHYNGDGNFLTSSGSTVQTVGSSRAATTTTLMSSQNPSVSGQAVTFTATVTSTSSGTPTGTVTFFNNFKIPLGTSTLNSSGVATFTTSTLSVGNHVITARYNGDSNFNSSTSTALTQTVNAAAVATTFVGQTKSPGQPPQLAAALAFETKLQENGFVTNAFGPSSDDGSDMGSSSLTSSQVDAFFAAKAIGGNSNSADQLFQTLGAL